MVSDLKWEVHKYGVLLKEHKMPIEKNVIVIRLFVYEYKYYTELWINNYLHYFSEVND